MGVSVFAGVCVRRINMKASVSKWVRDSEWDKSLPFVYRVDRNFVEGKYFF
jgi:hypothetical protein